MIIVFRVDFKTVVMNIALAAGGVIVGGILLWYSVSIYNQLIALEKRVSESKQNIDVVLKQRSDELSKLIDTVRTYMDYEEEVFTKLTEAREEAERADTLKEEAKADEQVKEALVDFQARAEEYPELQSNENVKELQTRIAKLESQISDRRETYNDSVTRFNTRIKQIPYLFVARPLNYTERELFEADESEKADVDMSELER